MITIDSHKLEPRCLCGTCRVTTGSIIIGIAEFLVICHTLIFAFSNYSAGEERYEIYNPIFAKVVKYDYLLPFLVVQLIWLVTCIVLIVGVKIPAHWLLLPHVAIQGVIIAGGTTMLILAIYNMQSVDEVSWELMASLTLCVLVTVSELYLTYVVILCFRYLKQQRVAVAIERRWLSSENEEAGRVWSSRAQSRAQSAVAPIQMKTNTTDIGTTKY